MASTKELIQTLKEELHKKKMTYRQVAKSLKLSESTVKRSLNPPPNPKHKSKEKEEKKSPKREEGISLKRLESICELVGLDILQLATKAVENRQCMDSLDEDDERKLVSNTKLLLLAIHLIHGWTYEEVLNNFAINPLEGQSLLTELDKMKIIELLPENKVHVLLSPRFKWIKNGPIQLFFEEKIQKQFFESDFHNPGEKRLVLTGWMLLENVKVFHERLLKLAKEFEVQVDNNKNIPIEERKATTLVMAIKPWTLSIFDPYRKTPLKK